jgi:hypothetical protein
VVLSDGEQLQSELVGERCLLEEVAHPLLSANTGM